VSSDDAHKSNLDSIQDLGSGAGHFEDRSHAEITSALYSYKSPRMSTMPPVLQFLLFTFAGWVNRTSLIDGNVSAAEAGSVI
jgi:hypothetical protein